MESVNLVVLSVLAAPMHLPCFVLKAIYHRLYLSGASSISLFSHTPAHRALSPRMYVPFYVHLCALITAEDATPPHPLSSYLLVDLILMKPSSKWAAADGSFSVPGDSRAPCSHCTLCPGVPADLSRWSWDLHATLDALAFGAVRGSEPSLVSV